MPSELNGSTIGYNFFCEATGHRTQERYIGEETIAQIGNNWDIPQRGGTISYCMAGDFRVEKPTQMQVDDFKQFLTELEDAGFTVSSVVQHKDLHPGRICAALTEADLQALTQRPPSRESVSQKIARLENELVRSRAMIKQLTGMVTLLIRMFNK